MPERNIEALRQLRRVVEAAPDDLFNMDYFTAQRRCGTVHCAAGWFAVDKWARTNTEIGKYFDQEGHLVHTLAMPAEGLARIFGLGFENARTLFFTPRPFSRITSIEKSEVIANIDRLIDGSDAIPYGSLTLEAACV